MRGYLFVSKILLLFTAALCHTSAEGQSALAQKNLQRQKWERAYELLAKATAKDSLNVTAKYVLAQYFFSGDNPAFQLDSAYKHVIGALNDFRKTSPKERVKLLRFPVDSVILYGLKEQIETAAFAESTQIQSEESWASFIQRFPTSGYIPKARQQRDSVAFEIAARENTYMAFHDFLKKYPDAVQFAAAHARYEKLLLDTKTADQTLESFERFLTEHPTSTYRSFVEQTIFEYRTASAEHNRFVEFIRKYPESPFAVKAKNILFHLIPERERVHMWPAEFTSDSLARILALQNTYLVPILKNKKYGLADAKGIDVLEPVLDSLPPSYHCGNIKDDVILLHDRVISGTGSCVWKSPVKKFDDIGSGFLLFENDDCKFIVHKSGFKVGADCIDDAIILNGKFVAVKSRRRWSLYTLSGRLLEQDLDDCYSIKDVVCLRKNNLTQLVMARELAILPRTVKPAVHEYEDAKAWNRDLILVRSRQQSGLLDHNLDFIVPLGDHSLSPVFCGVVASTSSGFRIYTAGGSADFKSVVAQDPWLAVKDSVWRIVDPNDLSVRYSPFDSISFYGSFPLAQRNDSSFIFFTPARLWKGLHPARIEFISGQDSTYLLIEAKGKKSLYSRGGEKLFTASFDKIQSAGRGMFIVHRGEKKGVINASGKLLLPVEYDAIGTLKDGTMSLLKSSRFGLYDYASKREIRPLFDKNLLAYNSKIVIASRNELYGLVGWDNRPMSKFEFKEIRYWNDTTALVRKDTWMLYEIKTGAILLDRIKDITMIRDEPYEKIAIVYQDTDHGVLHSRNGIIIPISYSDIINVGSHEVPLYFTEKHVEAASVFVVIYFDSSGKFLRKEVYDPEEYDKIYCNAN